MPGSNGTYPLVFTRTANSRANAGDPEADLLGNAGNWRHSYQWSGVPDNTGGYYISYPDGRLIDFASLGAYAPAGYSYYRGPIGTADQLQPTGTINNNGYYSSLTLLLSDGGRVYFNLSVITGAYRVAAITDPYGSVTYFTDAVVGSKVYLTTITEPGGRSLNLNYNTYTFGGFSWTVLTSVTATNSHGTATQTVTYSYPTTNPPAYPGTATYYLPLTGVTYQETNTSGGPLTATYNYYCSTGGIPLLINCDDPHYAGAMTRIAYTYNLSNSGVWGCVQSEVNYPTPSESQTLYNVSSLTQDQVNTPTTATETRGDKADSSGTAIVRAFTYGESATGPNQTTTNAKKFQPTTITNFHASNTTPTYTHLYYSPNTIGVGRGYINGVLDVNGNTTAYATEPYTGKTTGVTLPDGRTRSTVWQSMDGTTTTAGTTTSGGSTTTPCTLPYFIFTTTDERGNTTTYYRYTNTGYVQHIRFPDGTTETYTYQPFYGSHCTYYKVGSCVTRLGATITYTYGSGSSGDTDLLTSVSRSYAGAPQPEVTTYSYDSFDRLSKVVDPRGVSDSYSYNGRHSLTQILHSADGSHIDYGYDNYGDRTTVSDELGHVTGIVYDDYRRVTSKTVPVNAPIANSSQNLSSRYVAYAYDRRDTSDTLIGAAASHTASNWSVSWMPTGAAVQRIFSPCNWLTDEYDGMYVNGSYNPVDPVPGNGAVHIGATYSPSGKPLSTTDAQGFTTTYTYDSCDRQLTLTDPLGGASHTTTYVYYAAHEHCTGGAQLDCSGLLKSIIAPGTDANSQPNVTTKNTGYDVNGHVTQTVNQIPDTFTSAT